MVTLTQPSAGDTDWTTEINGNWQAIQDVIGTDMTQGSVLFAGASGVYSQDNSHLFWNDASNLLGVGTDSPASIIHAVNDGAANVFLDRYSTNAWGPSFIGRKGRNTAASPATAVLGDECLNLAGWGYDGTTFQNYATLTVKAAMIGGVEHGELLITGMGGDSERNWYQVEGRQNFQRWFLPQDGTEQMRLNTTGLRIEPSGVGGNASRALHVKSSSVVARFERESAGLDVAVELLNSNTPAAVNTGVGLDFEMMDDSDSSTTYARCSTYAKAVTDGSEKGQFIIEVQDSGTLHDDYVIDENSIVQKWSLNGTEFMRGNLTGLIIEPGGVHGNADKPAEVIQDNASGAVPVMSLKQDDIDDTFIDFIGTAAADGSRSISTDTTEDSAKYGAIRVEINGTTKWIRIYDDES